MVTWRRDTRTLQARRWQVNRNNTKESLQNDTKISK